MSSELLYINEPDEYEDPSQKKKKKNNDKKTKTDKENNKKQDHQKWNSADIINSNSTEDKAGGGSDSDKYDEFLKLTDKQSSNNEQLTSEGNFQSDKTNSYSETSKPKKKADDMSILQSILQRKK